MKNQANSGATEYLKSLIPNLDQFSYLSGTEGRVYFVDDSVVVKTYFESAEDLMIFNEFCKEIQLFGEMGYAVPKIYSWASVPCETGDNFLTFILQERIRGKPLFETDISKMYNLCKKLCSKEEFDSIVKKKKDNPELLGLIIREYISYFLELNKTLGLMSEKEIERFISTNYNLGINSRYSMPDVQASNVIFDGKKLTIIDNGFIGLDKGLENPNRVKASVLRDMLFLFYNNGNINFLANTDCKISGELKKMSSENMEACFVAMRRFVRKVNQMYNPVLTNIYDYEACRTIAEEIFESVWLAGEICSEIQKEC